MRPSGNDSVKEESPKIITISTVLNSTMTQRLFHDGQSRPELEHTNLKKGEWIRRSIQKAKCSLNVLFQGCQCMTGMFGKLSHVISDE